MLNTTPIFALRPTIMSGSTALDAGIDASGQIKPPLKYLVYTKNCLDQRLPLAASPISLLIHLFGRPIGPEAKSNSSL